MTADRPLLITVGDPAGVGPELALRGAWWAAERGIPIAVVGHAELLRRVAEQVALQSPPVVVSPEDAAMVTERAAATALENRHPYVIHLEGLPASRVRPGHVDAETGRASLEYVEWAITACLAGRTAGVITGPIHKEAWHAAGARHPGHTELFAERCGVQRHCMMLAAPTIRCALVTVHVGLADVPDLLSTSSVWETIELAEEAVRRMLGRPVRIAVCGLNPHAGEAGLFGRREEERIIQPAIEQARSAGLDIRGPLPPDTAFLPSIRAEIDVYICMYHDQGLIPLKAIAFDDAVNITLGLPIVRTSVDHGTALDLAWRGTASDSSMRAAIDMAARLAGYDSPSGER